MRFFRSLALANETAHESISRPRCITTDLDKLLSSGAAALVGATDWTRASTGRTLYGREANMQENIVRDLCVSDGSRGIKASYFVEAGILHASLEGRNLILPLGDDGSEETVRRLIVGHIQTKKWRERIAARWHGWQAD